MGLRDRAQTPPADDQFFRQLAGGAPADAQGAPPAPESPEFTALTSGGIDPHAAHPIGRPEEPQSPRRRIRPTPRQDAAPRRVPASSPRPHRLLAASALAVGALAAVIVVLGAGQSDTPQATAAGPRGASNGSPAIQDARLRAWWTQDGETDRRERWRRDAEATITGRLTVADGGRPIAGAVLTILAADASRRDAVNRTVGEVRTGRDGRFEAAIAIDEGASRKRLTFTYLARANDTVPAATARATLAVTPPVALQADARRIDRGEAVRLDGRTVPGARITVAARPPASERWRPLDNVQADRDGVWRATVRAPEDASTGTWRIRAHVAQSRDNGYVGAHSDPVSVEVD